ncbi:DUF2269 family protein [Leifsonia sp. Root112D2]|uniref:DUF2269 family protein n=1 Tax=Leifsonia sp. Root112D2 TaxID=1736426 RepID=UPI0006F8622D|nr:DUF2269 family protein [Leifsonia sp. Root112D2]KQV06097.1 conjugal transfer protein TrbL [Leifsonia sp. Root112D2]
MDTLFSILHVAAAVFIVGPLAILPHSAPALLRSGNGASVVKLAKTVNLFSWLSLLVIIFGFGVMGMSDPKYHVSFTDTWIWLSVVLYVIALVLIRVLVTPGMTRAGRAVEADASAKFSVGAISGGAGIATLLLIAVVVLMVWKP